MDGEQVDVDVEVEVSDDGASEPAGDTTAVVVTAPADTGVPGDVMAMLVDHGERLVRLEDAVSRLSVDGFETAVTAEHALAEVERVAEETEEAVATLAEATDEAKAEVIDEVEDIAPGRDHPWFAKRSLVGSRSDA